MLSLPSRLVTASILNVPLDYSSIVDAIEASQARDTILVAPGRYEERIIFPPHDICLFSQFIYDQDTATISSTILSGQMYGTDDTSSVLNFFGNQSRLTQVVGFTITAGHGFTFQGSDTSRKWGGAMYGDGASPIIQNCRIIENVSLVYAAFYFDHGHPQIADCEIAFNCGEVNLCSIGLNILDSENAEFLRNNIHSNRACNNGAILQGQGITIQWARAVVRDNYFHDYEGFYYFGVFAYDSHIEITNNRFERLRAPIAAHCIVMTKYPATVSDNVFRDIELGEGVCIELSYGGNPTNHHRVIIERNWFDSLSSTGGFPPALFIQHPNADISNNVFVDCRSQNPVVTFSATVPQGCDAIVQRNVFFGNRQLVENPRASCIQFLGSGDLCEVNDNWFEMNIGPTVISYSVDHDFWDLSLNYWGHPSGPYHPTENPTGQGDTVDINIHVTPWLTEPPDLGVDVGERLKLNPEDWTLEQIFPNPFNGQTNIRIIAKKPQPMSVVVYNTLGQKIANVWQGVIAKDEPTLIRWDGVDNFGRGVASGVYYVVAEPRGSLRGAPKAQKAVLLR